MNRTTLFYIRYIILVSFGYALRLIEKLVYTDYYAGKMEDEKPLVKWYLIKVPSLIIGIALFTQIGFYTLFMLPILGMVTRYLTHLFSMDTYECGKLMQYPVHYTLNLMRKHGTLPAIKRNEFLFFNFTALFYSVFRPNRVKEISIHQILQADKNGTAPTIVIGNYELYYHTVKGIENAFFYHWELDKHGLFPAICNKYLEDTVISAIDREEFLPIVEAEQQMKEKQYREKYITLEEHAQHLQELEKIRNTPENTQMLIDLLREEKQ